MQRTTACLQDAADRGFVLGFCQPHEGVWLAAASRVVDLLDADEQGQAVVLAQLADPGKAPLCSAKLRILQALPAGAATSQQGGQPATVGKLLPQVRLVGSCNSSIIAPPT